MRQFTRSEVEAYFREVHPDGHGGTTTINSVSLLRSISSPTIWAVDFTIVDDITKYRFHSIALIRQDKDYNGNARLLPVGTQDIPADYATVKDEDKAIKEREAREEAEWRERIVQREPSS